MVLCQGIPALGCAFCCSVAASGFCVVFDGRVVHGLSVLLHLQMLGSRVPGSSCRSGAGAPVILSRFPCFPQARCALPNAVGLWGALAPKPCLQIRCCGAVLGLHHLSPCTSC